MSKLTAIVIGATGATGQFLVQNLIQDDAFDKILLFSRTKINYSDVKIEEFIIDFENLDQYKLDIQGDILFSCLGTTIKVAKTKENQYKIDVDYQYNIAKIASENNVKKLVLVSSIGANAKSWFFYPRIKGILEEKVKKLSFKAIHIFQPPSLDRREINIRQGEQSSLKIIRFFNKLGLFNSLSPLDVDILAKSMIKASKSNKEGINCYKSQEIAKF